MLHHFGFHQWWCELRYSFGFWKRYYDEAWVNMNTALFAAQTTTQRHDTPRTCRAAEQQKLSEADNYSESLRWISESRGFGERGGSVKDSYNQTFISTILYVSIWCILYVSYDKDKHTNRSAFSYCPQAFILKLRHLCSSLSTFHTFSSKAVHIKEWMKLRYE